jgi:hypothetical protein
MIARGIAEAILTSLGAKRLDKKNHNPAPLVVVLAGNNRTGAYSLGAGRWLSLRGIRVLGVVCAGEDDELDVYSRSINLTSGYPYTTDTLQKCRRPKSGPWRFTTYNRSIAMSS